MKDNNKATVSENLVHFEAVEETVIRTYNPKKEEIKITLFDNSPPIITIKTSVINSALPIFIFENF